MKRLFIVCFVLTSLSINAQEKTKDSLSNWTTKGVFTFLFNQASFSNWVAGGENSIAGTVSINYDFNYKKDDWTWDNKIITKYGIANVSGVGTRKTDDFFEINSLVGKHAGKYWSYSFLLNIRSQFTTGYDYSTDPRTVTSEFFAPGYVTTGPGLYYKKSESFNFHVSPATVKATFVSQRFAGFYGTDAGETSRYEFGFYAALFYKGTLMENVTVENIFNAYSNYLEKAENIDFNYQVNFVMQINKYLSTSLNLHAIMDEDATGRLQFKQLFGLGVNYIF